MNLILLFPEDFIDRQTVRLTGRRLRHVLEVHRAAVGDTLAVGQVNGALGTGTVTRIDARTLEIVVFFHTRPPLSLPITVILSLPRPKVMRRVLFSLSVLGVKKIVLINSARVEKSYWQTPFLQQDEIQRQLLLGLEQAKDTQLPDVQLRTRFKPFVEDELPALMRESLPLLSHPAAALPCPRGVNRSVTLAIGPEGGFVQYEVDVLTRLGFSAVTLGERILNVQTAVTALVSRLF